MDTKSWELKISTKLGSEFKFEVILQIIIKSSAFKKF